MAMEHFRELKIIADVRISKYFEINKKPNISINTILMNWSAFFFHPDYLVTYFVQQCLQDNRIILRP